MQVRDTALAIKDEMPKSDVNKEFYTQNIDKEVSKLCPFSYYQGVGFYGLSSFFALGRCSGLIKKNYNAYAPCVG